MFGKSAQVGLEYLILIGFILVGVAIAFSFAYINYEQSIKTAQANDALVAITGTADRVYSLGEGNTQYVDVAFPAGMQGIEVVNVCGNRVQQVCPPPSTGDEAGCNCSGNEDINYSGIRLTTMLVGGSSEIMRLSKAKLVLEGLPSVGSIGPGLLYPVRVSWTEVEEEVWKVKLQWV